MGVELTFECKIPEVIAKIDKTLKQRMAEAVQLVRNTTVETLSGKRSGREYYVPGTRRHYTASAPGEPPAQATGRLRKSVATEIRQDGKVGVVGTALYYGLFLEFGTSKMQPRPWLRPSFEKSERRIKEILGREIK